MTANQNVTRFGPSQAHPFHRRQRIGIPADRLADWFWWAELTHPYWAFTEAGYEVEIRSPDGGSLVADSFSDPEDSSGYSADDILSLGFKNRQSTRRCCKTPRASATCA